MIASPKVSVIVAVFQAVKTLRRCLDSIKNQTMTEWECLLVDDGSSDGSGKMCDEYASADARFRVIHKPNEGVAIARQTGIDSAKGDYVIFADADDWVEPDWLEKLYGKISTDEADMAICDYERISSNHTEYWIGCPGSLDKDEYLRGLLAGHFWGALWNKLVKRDCYRLYVSIPPHMDYWEDLYITCQLLTKEIKITYVPQMLYHYDIGVNDKSLTKKHRESDIRSMMLFIDTFYPILSDKQFEDGWYYLKTLAIHWIFLLKQFHYHITAVYPECHERYIMEAKKSSLLSRKRSIALCMKGHQALGVILYRVISMFIG
jgi:glycosyltransferase involved in cell wall biosynthesis